MIYAIIHLQEINIEEFINEMYNQLLNGLL